LRLSLLVKLVVPLVIVAGLAGYFVTQHFQTRSDAKFTALSLAGTAREYRTEAASLRLAPGWKWPSAPVPSVASDGRGMRYQRGWGIQAADFYWYCSWSSRVLDPRVAASGRRKALAQVLSIRTKYFFKTALAPNTKPVFDQVLRKAARGDVRSLRRNYALNCPKQASGGTS
jgi:hypothetical protein